MGHANRRWFHHNLTGLEAELLLLQKGVSGSFLARPSHSTPGSFTLSVRRGDSVTHIRIQNTEDFLDLYGGEKFATLAELVTYYMENEGQLKEKNGDLIELKYPLVSEDPTTERWFHGKISGKEAENMLLEKGKYGCFLVRESAHQPGSYVLSVVNSDQVVAHIRIHGKPNGYYDVGGGNEFSSLKKLIEFYSVTPLVEKSGGLVPIKQPFNATRFNVRSIAGRIQQLEQEYGHGSGLAGFLEEFEELHQEAHGRFSSRLEGSKHYNRKKNRYKNILPFDQTQVKLTDGDPDELGSDYINANYISWPIHLTESLSNTSCSSLGFGSPQASADHQLMNSHAASGGGGLPSQSGVNGGAAFSPTGSSANSSSTFFFTGTPRYIATQGPVQATQDSFWRMVWQERCAVIVMITKFVERGRTKCICYWPTASEGERVFRTYGHVLRVKHLSERNLVNYTLRQLLLTREPVDHQLDDQQQSAADEPGGSPPPPPPPPLLSASPTASTNHLASSPTASPDARTTGCGGGGSAAAEAGGCSDSLKVYHYHFTVWPDHGTPSDPSCVLDFVLDISTRQDSIPDAGPIVVHCSAGIGRTGAFIVIDMLINYIKTMGLDCDIDISRTIQAVREQRSGMVQTETQYRFIYNAVCQYVNTVCMRIQMDNDLRSSGRDYTNINRAADDVGVFGAISPTSGPLFFPASVASALHSTSGKSSTTVVTTSSHSGLPISACSTQPQQHSQVASPQPRAASNPGTSLFPNSLVITASTASGSGTVGNCANRKQATARGFLRSPNRAGNTPSTEARRPDLPPPVTGALGSSPSLTASSTSSSATTSTPKTSTVPTNIFHRLSIGVKSKPKS